MRPIEVAAYHAQAAPLQWMLDEKVGVAGAFEAFHINSEVVQELPGLAGFLRASPGLAPHRCAQWTCPAMRCATTALRRWWRRPRAWEHSLC
eukprot:843424-Prymnesium_polylepis.1